MVRSLISILLLAPITVIANSHDPNLLRPLTNADSVIAVLHESMGRDSDVTPKLILAIWPDGKVVWSENRLKGGSPYRCGQIKNGKVKDLLARFEKDGLFVEDKNLSRAHFGPDAPFTTILLRDGKNELKMQSWHELFESGGGLMATGSGVGPRTDRGWAAEMKKEPNDYLYFRMIWSETRGRLFDLIPFESKQCNGKFISKDGSWFWQEH